MNCLDIFAIFDLAVRHSGPEVNFVGMETCPVDSALRSTAQTQHIDCKATAPGDGPWRRPLVTAPGDGPW
ncbi:unnamed protein product [Arctogadus glacialis]